MKHRHRQRVHVLTLGCAKNTVDSEKLMAQLALSGVEIAPSLEEADIAVVNTCGFITSAKEESIEALIAQVRRKERGRLSKIFAMGCLVERYREDLVRKIPEIDRFFGTGELEDILHSLGARYRRELLGERLLSTPAHTAYLKIAEGCDRPCTFCAIPLMRGVLRSLPADDVLGEARMLASRGVREIVVIGQDTTSYGLDVSGRRQLPDLLDRLADIDGLSWVRLMYAYPAGFPLETLDVLARRPALCKYIDMPVQHGSDRVLRSMRRGISRATMLRLIDTIRERVPGIAIRTTLIVGYPEEGEQEFEELMEFVDTVRFDRLGVFQYSREEGTSAYPLGDPVPPAEKERRQSEVMALQRGISESRNRRLLRSRPTVLVDRREGDVWFGRTEHDAPDIDNEVVIHSPVPLTVGSFRSVEIVEAYEYDIVGEAVIE